MTNIITEGNSWVLSFDVEIICQFCPSTLIQASTETLLGWSNPESNLAESFLFSFNRLNNTPTFSETQPTLFLSVKCNCERLLITLGGTFEALFEELATISSPNFFLSSLLIKWKTRKDGTNNNRTFLHDHCSSYKKCTLVRFSLSWWPQNWFQKRWTSKHKQTNKSTTNLQALKESSVHLHTHTQKKRRNVNQY